jgi:SAM-dependent methyltransferase
MSDESAETAGPGPTGAPAGPGPIPAEARAANLELWNAWTKIHEHAPGYNTDGFLNGETALKPVELEELGPYVRQGTTLLHLQCHFGLDTLSWARLGADVVGLDFSDEAIALARKLADEAGLSARAEFVCSDLYDADAHLGDRRFDVVFVNWGAIEWLPDLERWATIIARHLKPGGTFYMAEIHPFARSLDDTAPEGVLRVAYRYFPAPDEPDVDAVEGSYADRDADTEGLVAYGWSHSFAEIIGSLTGAGLRIDHLHEFPFSPAPFWDWMVEDAGHVWWLPGDESGHRRDLPFSYSIRATKPAT